MKDKLKVEQESSDESPKSDSEMIHNEVTAKSHATIKSHSKESIKESVKLLNSAIARETFAKMESFILASIAL